MAPNGTSRKTPAGSAKPKNKPNPLFGEVFEDLRDEGAKENIRMSGVKKAGSWTSEGPKSTTASVRSSPAPHSNSVQKVSSPISKAFPTSTTLPDRSEFQKCQHCKRAVSRAGMPKHVESCLNKKQEKQRKKKEAKDARDAAARKEKNAANGIADSDEEDEADAEGKKTIGATKTGLGSGASKKRKAGEPAGPDDTPDASAPAKKKSKKSGGATDNSKSKAARPKAPVDVEKQCGVELPQGGQCARSLTCKSHSMGAKRAVPGRSAPYDKLLMEYQRKNQAKLQKAQFDANAPDPGDEELALQGPVDSEDEKEAVMGSVGRAWGGRPIWQHTAVPLRERYRHNRIRGMLQSAFGNRGSGGGGGGGGLFGGGNGGGGSGGFFGSTAPANSASGSNAGAAPVADDNGIVHARRGSVVPGVRSMMAPMASRKSSVVANTGSTSAVAATVGA